jgi:NAD(P) transhydrogenase subunit alpha
MATVLIPKECLPEETRIAATPETVGKLCQAGLEVLVEQDAGAASYIEDESLHAAGAEIVSDIEGAYGRANLILKVREPSQNDRLGKHEAALVAEGAIVLSLMVPQQSLEAVRLLTERRASCFSMNLVPRITRAQKMDALSSQSNIAGYKAALIAAAHLPKFFPLLMTAAGTVKPAKVVVMGAGVAGLQAIATAKRLGAQVWATDVRLAAKEQVESLGARFIDVPGMEDLEDERGYAKEATPEFLARQRQIVADHVADSDAVITTALVPGRRAPELIPTEVVQRMRAGSVIVDIAAEQGGNCAETVAGETVVRHGVAIIGPRNLPATVPFHASELYARNVLAFVQPIVKDGELTLDFEDEVLADSVVTHAGEVRHEPTQLQLSGGKESQ